MKIDINTGKKYTDQNIPLDRLSEITTENGKSYRIVAQDFKHPNDSWYNGKFIGDYYAVFVKVNKFMYQQISNWYFRYGNAENKMLKLAGKI